MAGALGLGCWAGTLVLGEMGAVEWVAMVSLVRLLPVWVLVRGRRGLWLGVAMPYPLALVELLYLERSAWLPGDWARTLSGPTEFLIVVSGLLLASLGWSSWCVAKSRGEAGNEDLRTLGKVVFGLTAGAILVSYPPWSLAILRWVAQPVALVGLAACAAARDQ